MGRKIMRVPPDFSWPLSQVWEGYLLPDKFDEEKCPDCERGHSWQYEVLHDLWYGYRKFTPAMTGSEPLTVETPAVRAMAERHIANAPEFYGSGEAAIIREARRLSHLWNGLWCHHLSQADVDALVEGGRLYYFTHQVVPGKGWQPKSEPVRPTAAQVNEWSIRTTGHDGINAYVVITARCERYGMPTTCATCQGHSGLEKYEGQRAEAEAWEPTEPPEGEGWQLWETVSEGSPISPVFSTPEELAEWMSSPAYQWGVSRGTEIPYESALAFVRNGWAPSVVASAKHGVETGEQAVGRMAREGQEGSA